MEHSTCPTCRGTVLDDIDDRSTDYDFERDIELMYGSSPNYDGLLNSYSDQSDDSSLSNMSFSVSETFAYSSLDIDGLRANRVRFGSDADLSSEDSDEDIAASSTLVMEANSSSSSGGGNVSIISISDQSSDGSDNENESPIDSGSSSEFGDDGSDNENGSPSESPIDSGSSSEFEDDDGNDTSGATFSDINDLSWMVSDDDDSSD